MSAVTVVKIENGKLSGFGEKGERAWARFQKTVSNLALGETLAFEWFEPRSPSHHRLFFAKLGALLDRQEAFDSAHDLRLWLTVGAGYCDLRPGATGELIAIPQSIAFHRLDEADFCDLHGRVDAFLWQPHARAYLWPALTDQQSFDAVQQLWTEFQQ